MQTKSTRAAETAALLQTFGLELSAGDLVVMTDFALAESAYIHHSTVPVAVAAMAVVSPTFARGRFPKLRLVDMVAKVPAMAKVSTASMSGRVGSIIVPMRWSPPRWPNGGDPTRHCHPRAR